MEPQQNRDLKPEYLSLNVVNIADVIGAQTVAAHVESEMVQA
jgi:hypothetical protein